MNRVGLYIPDILYKPMKAIADETGYSVSELVRQAIAAYLKERDKEKSDVCDAWND